MFSHGYVGKSSMGSLIYCFGWLAQNIKERFLACVCWFFVKISLVPFFNLLYHFDYILGGLYIESLIF